MGEATSSARGRRHDGRGRDKDERRHLAVVPPQIEDALWRVAERRRQRALVVLLIRYYLRPEQIAGATLDDHGLRVPGFRHPIPVDPAERDELASWFSRRRRPRSAQAVRDALGDLLRAIVHELSARPLPEGAWPVDWGELVDVGVVALRRLARERHAESCAFEEAVYRELIHHETADPYEVLRFLSRPARQLLAAGAEAILAEIQHPTQEEGP